MLLERLFLLGGRGGGGGAGRVNNTVKVES